jgi:WD40 repeat protein
MLAAHVEDDIHTLEVYIFNDTRGELFLLHDILLPSEPMVVEYLNYYKEDSSTRFNLAAVGCMDAEINIWDLNVSGCLEPKLRIGGPKAKKDFRHTDAVLALAWAKDSRRILASGSADNTVRIWDMSDGDEIHKHTGFEKYVQCINWHPEETVLLAGSADKKLRLLDCRSDNMSKEWTLESGVECVQWNHHGFQYFLASTSDGFISYYDIRGSKKPMWNLKAHDSDCIFALSTHCRELMISGSHDETVKVWNMENSPFTNSVPELVTVKHMNIGPILSLKANPDVSYVFCAGGMKKDNYLYVWDVRESEDVMKCFAESGSRGIKIRSRQKHEYGKDLTPEELQHFYRKGTFEPKPGPSSGDTTENNWGRIKFKNKKKSRTVKVYVTDPPDTTSTEPVAGPSSASTERPPPPREHKKMHPKTKGGGKRKKEREINKKKK